MVLTLTMLLMMGVAVVLVPMLPNFTMSAEPGLPVLGFQLALTFQLFAPGDATFQI